MRSPAADLPESPAILVTRPVHQAAAFIARVSGLGIRPVALPVIEIAFRTEPLQQHEYTSLESSELWIFTSANAVEGAQRCGLFTKPVVSRVACIGLATSAALKQIGVTIDYLPPQSGNSENLISFLISVWQPTGSVTIIRGNKGRDTLKKSLQALGCEVHYLDVYQRLLPDTDPAAIQQALSMLPGIISITSNQGLINLLKLIPENSHSALLSSHLIVNSERCAELARKSGFAQQIVLANPPGDDGQSKALEKLMADIL